MTSFLPVSNSHEQNLSCVWKSGRGRGFARYGFFREEPHHYKELKTHGEEAEYAAFGADGAAGEPFRAVENGVGEMALHEGAAVRNREEVTFSPVEAGMEADGVPEVAGAMKRKSEKDPDESHARRADETFAGIVKVDSAE